jgi:tetratricopeptide (TPR) repeat protein
VRAAAVQDPDHPYVATSLNNLALLYGAQGHYAAAEPLHRRALAIREKTLGPDHPDVAVSLNNLADLYQFQGRYADAEPLYQRALAILEKAHDPDHLYVATSLNNLAVLYKRARGLSSSRVVSISLLQPNQQHRADHRLAVNAKSAKSPVNLTSQP